MKVSVPLGPVTFGIEDFGRFSTAEAIAEIAGTAEELGFDAVYTTEHPAPTVPGLAEGGHHAPDPFVALAFAAAVTTRIKLHTHLVVAGYRNPFLLAKAAATLDFASGGRLILGTGAGYLAGEFAGLGVDFSERNELADEVAALLPEIWSGRPVDVAGRRFTAAESVALPRPAQRPHPPIWVGGNSRKAMRRAARHGQGWAPVPNPPGDRRAARTASIFDSETLRRRVDELRRLEREFGRTDPLDVAFAVGYREMWEGRTASPEAMLRDARDLVEAGVTWILPPFGGRTRAEFLEQLAAFAEAVLPVVTDL